MARDNVELVKEKKWAETKGDLALIWPCMQKREGWRNRLPGIESEHNLKKKWVPWEGPGVEKLGSLNNLTCASAEIAKKKNEEVVHSRFLSCPDVHRNSATFNLLLYCTILYIWVNKRRRKEADYIFILMDRYLIILLYDKYILYIHTRTCIEASYFVNQTV